MTDIIDQPITNLIVVRLVWDAAMSSPPEFQHYNGVLVAVPPEAIPLPVRGFLFGLRGYSRQTANDPVPWEWVLQGDVDPADAFVDSLTGRGSWLVADARALVKLMIQRLFSAGIPRQTLVEQFPQLVQAIAAEVRAIDALPQSLLAHTDGEDQSSMGDER